jgi:hypothetical protein
MLRKLLIGSLTAGFGLLGVAAVATPAQAATCTWLDSTWVDSGVSSASGNLYRCSDGASTWYTVSGRLWDDACDDRTAYLDLHAEGQGGTTKSVSGCGNSREYAASWPSPVFGVWLRTRACNVTCSDDDDDWLYLDRR